MWQDVGARQAATRAPEAATAAPAPRLQLQLVGSCAQRLKQVGWSSWRAAGGRACGASPNSLPLTLVHAAAPSPSCCPCHCVYPAGPAGAHCTGGPGSGRRRTRRSWGASARRRAGARPPVPCISADCPWCVVALSCEAHELESALHTVRSGTCDLILAVCCCVVANTVCLLPLWPALHRRRPRLLTRQPSRPARWLQPRQLPRSWSPPPRSACTSCGRWKVQGSCWAAACRSCGMRPARRWGACSPCSCVRARRSAPASCLCCR